MPAFQISAFTHTGAHRFYNQDRVLVGEAVLSSGIIHQHADDGFRAFVADGVGGSRHGDFSAQFVLEQLLAYNFNAFNSQHFITYCKGIQRKLGEKFLTNTLFTGSATTIVGAVYQGDHGYIINAGDADARKWNGKKWKVLNHKQVSKDIVVNPPITSYFGGDCNNLALEITPFTLENDEILVLSSDGLFVSLTEDETEQLLTSGTSVSAIAEALYTSSQNPSSGDNVSAILIKKL